MPQILEQKNFTETFTKKFHTTENFSKQRLWWTAQVSIAELGFKPATRCFGHLVWLQKFLVAQRCAQTKTYMTNTQLLS